MGIFPPPPKLGDGETRKIRNLPNMFIILILSNPQLRKVSE